MEIKTRSADETIELGKKIGAFLMPNEIIALSGHLGAGKTTLIQGIAVGVGVADYVTSPTFIIINEYNGRLPFFHVDLYRLNDATEVEDLGIEEYFERGGVCVIEWAEKLGDLAPKNFQLVKIEILGENERKICVSSELAARLK
ncbi:MAG: tRNA (adenosine(37)-N6)-threonylcarbamoyltransferase complex ATPase subunit type 1 TsaE [Candidatus Saganbacteria bacterium]|nr:tRNA (adenosine(37)-N6)-threonylcarbamoyltransferase complex ATPase subunit type 1 TsaE [Candidatus Saganbacteria bacterium]